MGTRTATLRSIVPETSTATSPWLTTGAAIGLLAASMSPSVIIVVLGMTAVGGILTTVRTWSSYSERLTSGVAATGTRRGVTIRATSIRMMDPFMARQR